MEGSVVSLLSLCAVVLGWIVVNHQNNKREDRKEFRALVDRSRDLAMSIASCALEFHSKADSSLTSKLKWDLDALEIYLMQLPNFTVKDGPMLTRFAAFYDAVTGGDFEASKPQIKDQNSEEIRAVLRTRNKLVEEMECQFRAYFR